ENLLSTGLQLVGYLICVADTRIQWWQGKSSFSLRSATDVDAEAFSSACSLTEDMSTPHQRTARSRSVLCCLKVFQETKPIEDFQPSTRIVHCRSICEWIAMCKNDRTSVTHKQEAQVVGCCGRGRGSGPRHNDK
ncbi:hypothetical protein M514_00004, partial [Trichuris suis]